MVASYALACVAAYMWVPLLSGQSIVSLPCLSFSHDMAPTAPTNRSGTMRQTFLAGVDVVWFRQRLQFGNLFR
jgi:hypothetical protein